jgi:carotenoid 1,2-hydratase
MPTAPLRCGVLSLKTTGPAPSSHALRACGGFTWWYAEILDHAHDRAVVVIWSFGLPFLPGYASRERKGTAPSARTLPSVNVVAYERGREVFYLLHQFEAERAGIDSGTFTFGESTFVLDAANGTLRATLDLPVPGSRERMQGELVVDGCSVTMPTGVHTDLAHVWCPVLLPARGRATLDVGAVHFALEGHAYVDHNEGMSALHRLGIAHWVWGHAPTIDGRERIFYLLTPESRAAPEPHAFTVDETGSFHVEEAVRIDVTRSRAPRFGMPGLARAQVTVRDRPFLDLHMGALVDDGPFYLRYLARTDDGLPGTTEVIAPARIDTDWLRPLVRMRVSSETERPNPFLPLFTGPRAGRVRRLFGRA